jgi:cell pole-organizing protein PopZ
MGQAGAQREPSMEEILASIRRIIENNEPGQAGHPADTASNVNYDGAEDYAETEDMADGDGLDQETSLSQPAPADDEAAAQPVSLADVAARARALPQSFSAEVHTAGNVDESDAASEIDDAAAEELREALLSDEPVEIVVANNLSAEAEPVADTQAQPITPEAAVGQAAASPQAGGQLVSLQTGEKVAASFGELDAAIMEGQRRSFDEIAEELLRPMLTHWLDDNLPTLVERLVREEIERVARGNRR